MVSARAVESEHAYTSDGFIMYVDSMHVRMYVQYIVVRIVCVYTYVRTYVHVCTYVHTYVRTYVHVCTYVHTYVCTYVHGCTYVRMSVCRKLLYIGNFCNHYYLCYWKVLQVGFLVS